VSIFYSSRGGSKDSNPHDFHKIHAKQSILYGDKTVGNAMCQWPQL
jgi:hypothetical protein